MQEALPPMIRNGFVKKLRHIKVKIMPPTKAFAGAERIKVRSHHKALRVIYRFAPENCRVRKSAGICNTVPFLTIFLRSTPP